MKLRSCQFAVIALLGGTLAVAQELPPPTPPPAPTPEESPTPAAEAAPSEAPESTADSSADDGKKKDKKKGKNKKKDKDKDKDKDKEEKKDPEPKDPQSDAKDSSEPVAKKSSESSEGDWCAWLSDDPGTLYSDKSNPWFQSFRVGGRFQYQAAYLDGSDLYDRNYHDSYDEYRRFRIETRAKFLRFLSTEVDVNLVDDRRFRQPPDNDLDWGYDDFDTAILECDLLKAFDSKILDELSVAYGKMKMPITEEQRQSSKALFTVERSLLSDKLAGDESRPTGFLASVAKGDWSGQIGFFSGEDDADFIGAWNDGFTQFYSLTWQPDKDFSLTLDYVTTHQSGSDDAPGYHSAIALGSTYDKKHWGLQTSVMYGDNGYGDPEDNARNRANRQGDFYGVTVMPWYWIVKDRLQLVCRFEYARSEESEGLQLTNRYVRADHDDPLVDVANGRGSRYNAWYLGLNYYFCGDNAKIMAGVMYEDMAASKTREIQVPGPNLFVPDRGTLESLTYMIAFRTSF